MSNQDIIDRIFEEWQLKYDVTVSDEGLRQRMLMLAEEAYLACLRNANQMFIADRNRRDNLYDTIRVIRDIAGGSRPGTYDDILAIARSALTDGSKQE